MTDAQDLLPLKLVRYSNRKLYAHEVNSYVCLDKLYHTLKAGRAIEVRCNVTGVDMTRRILGEVFMRMCVRRNFVAVETLLALVRQDGPDLDTAEVI